jgi:hypothetical protein
VALLQSSSSVMELDHPVPTSMLLAQQDAEELTAVDMPGGATGLLPRLPLPFEKTTTGRYRRLASQGLPEQEWAADAMSQIYTIRLTPRISLCNDLQIIFDPYSRLELLDSMVAGVRLKIEF